MVYDLAMLKAFYTLYEGKIERIRTILERTAASDDFSRENFVCSFV